MSELQIIKAQKRIERNIKKLHPENPLVFAMQAKYRELETIKSKL